MEPLYPDDKIISIFRAVPSDTDTSAVDSDPNAMSGRHKRLGKRKRSLKNHDEAWFMAHDTKGTILVHS